MKLRIWRATAVAATLTIGCLAASPAHAQDVDPRIAHALSAVPGGILVADDTVFWPEHEMTLELPRSARAVGTCPTGSHCAFSEPGLGGLRLSWANCSSSHSVAALSSVGSIANARSGVTTRAHSSSGTVLGLAPSGGWSGVSGTVAYVSCSTGGPVL